MASFVVLRHLVTTLGTAFDNSYKFINDFFSFSNPLIINKDLTVIWNGSISDYQLQLSIKLNVNLRTNVTFSNPNFLTHI